MPSLEEPDLESVCAMEPAEALGKYLEYREAGKKIWARRIFNAYRERHGVNLDAREIRLKAEGRWPTSPVGYAVRTLDGDIELGSDFNWFSVKGLFLKGDELVLAKASVQQTTTTIENIQNGSVLGRAAMGGALFGGAGAVVGALAAPKKSNSETIVVETATLEILTSNQGKFTLRFGGSIHECGVWEALMGEVIAASVKQLPPPDALERLERAQILFKSGVLTEAEFEALKKSILSSP